MSRSANTGNDSGPDTHAENDEEVRWNVDGPRCECGASIERWHTKTDARVQVRVFGDSENRTVPACPDCVDWGGNNRSQIESVPHAIKEMQIQTSVEHRPQLELAIEHQERSQ